MLLGRLRLLNTTLDWLSVGSNLAQVCSFIAAAFWFTVKMGKRLDSLNGEDVKPYLDDSVHRIEIRLDKLTEDVAYVRGRIDTMEHNNRIVP